MRRAGWIAVAALLAGCGGAKKDAPPTDTEVAGEKDCAKKPDFVPLYSDAKVMLCSADHVEATGKDSGTILYTSAAAPAALLAWSKEQALKAGLAEQLSNPGTFAGGQGDAKTLFVMATPQDKGSRVMINWGRQR